MTPSARAIGTYLDHLSVERGLSRNTLSSYQRDLSRYAVFLGDRDLAEVTAADLTAFLSALRGEGLSTASAARTMSAVRGLHRFAAREGLTSEDVSRDVKPPSPPKRLPKALDVSQIETLLAAPATDDALGLRDRALLEFLYGTGARISEAVGLVIDSLDLDSVVLHGKGGKSRLIPLGRFAREALDAYLVRARPALVANGKGTPAVFLNARGGVLSRQSAWTILQKAASTAGIENVSPHTLRHSYATHLLDGGADVRVVQELLGHASVTTTQIYTLVTVDLLREVYATAHPRAR